VLFISLHVIISYL